MTASIYCTSMTCTATYLSMPTEGVCVVCESALSREWPDGKSPYVLDRLTLTPSGEAWAESIREHWGDLELAANPGAGRAFVEDQTRVRRIWEDIMSKLDHVAVRCAECNRTTIVACPIVMGLSAGPLPENNVIAYGDPPTTVECCNPECGLSIVTATGELVEPLSYSSHPVDVLESIVPEECRLQPQWDETIDRMRQIADEPVSDEEVARRFDGLMDGSACFFGCTVDKPNSICPEHGSDEAP